MPEDFNPAKRFHDLLSATPATNTDQVKAITVFSTILEVPEDNGPLLLTRISEFLSLPDKIRIAVESIDGVDLELYLDWYEQARRGINEVNFRGNWRSFMVHFPEGSMKSIQFCSNLLATHFPEKIVKDENIKDLIVKIDELLDDLPNSGLRSEDWFFVRHNLLKVRDALDGYSVGGLMDIEDAYSHAIGALATHPNTTTRLRDTEVWNSFCKVILATGWIISTYGGSSQLTHDINRFLDKDESVSSAIILENNEPVAEDTAINVVDSEKPEDA